MNGSFSAYLLTIKIELFALASVGASLVTATHLVQFIVAVIALYNIIRSSIKKKKNDPTN
jgi:hypothetical protein